MYNEPCDINAAGVQYQLPSLVRCQYHATLIAESYGKKPCTPGSRIFPLSETLRRLIARGCRTSSAERLTREQNDYYQWYLARAHEHGDHNEETDPNCNACTAHNPT